MIKNKNNPINKIFINNDLYDYIFKSDLHISLFSLFNQGIRLNNEMTLDDFNIEIKKTLSCFANNKYSINIIENTFWFGQFDWFFIGEYQGKIISFSEIHGVYEPFCYSFQNIPLEIISRNSFNFNYRNKKENMISTTEINSNAIFPNEDLYYKTLNDYIQFAKSNNIHLDQEYFNNKGELKVLYSPFEIDYEYAEFGIEHLKNKEFFRED